MNKSNLFIMVKKEILQLIRNKRIIIALFIPILLYPALFSIYDSASNSAEKNSEEKYYNIYIKSEIPEYLKEKIQENTKIKELDSTNSIKKDFKSKKLNLVIDYQIKNNEENFILTYDSGRKHSTEISNIIKNYINDYELYIQEEILERNNISIKILHPTIKETVDNADKIEKTSKSISNYLPMLLVITALLSVVNFAIELTTGEKERGTLETLLSIPINKNELIISKLLTCIFFGILAISINITVIVFMIPKFLDPILVNKIINLKIISILVLTIIPLLFISGSLSLSIGIFSNSHKESGAYISPLTIFFMIGAYTALIPGMELNNFFALIPIANSTLLIKSIFINTLNIQYFIMAFISNILFSLITISIMFKIFKNETILFSNGANFSFRFKRKLINKKSIINPSDSFLIIAASIIGYIYLNTILRKNLGIVNGTIAIQFISFLSIPLFFTWYLKADLKKSIAFNKVSPKEMLGSTCLWLSGLSLTIIYLNVIEKYISNAPTLLELNKILENTPTFKIFFFIAITPGICEEFLFRGIAFRSIEKYISPKAAIILTALLFSIIHLDVVRLFPTFILGLAFGYIAYKTKSIIPTVILHIINNGFNEKIIHLLSFNSYYLVIFSITLLFIGYNLFDSSKESIYNSEKVLS